MRCRHTASLAQMHLFRVVASLVILSSPALGVPAFAQQSVSLPPITVQIGRNFYPQEVWAAGKIRSWMRNDGEIVLRNQGRAPQVINVSFYAEAFHIPRDLQIAVDGRGAAQWQIQPLADRYIVLRALTLEPGEHVIVFHTIQTPESPASVGESSDRRLLSVAFSPFAIVEAASPAARMEWTAPFAASPANSPYFTPLENEAHYFRRQGRLLEAADGYERAVALGATDFTYLYYGITLVALDRRDTAQHVLTQCTGLKGSGMRTAWVRGFCGRVASYLGESWILSQPDQDPGRAARAQGRLTDALETYQRIVARAPNAVQAHFWLMVIYGLAERRTELRAHAERVIALTEDSPDGRFLKTLRPYF